MPPRPRPFFPDNLEKYTDMDQQQNQEQENTISPEQESVIVYATEFRSLARDSGFDNISLVDQFLRGLSPKIIQYLMVPDLLNSLEETIKISVRVDNRIYTMDHINCSHPQEKSRNPFVNRQPANSLTNEIGKNQENTVNMEIDAISSRPRGPLTEAEKTRRYKLGLCLYCRGKGHIALDCRRRKIPGKVITQQWTESYR
ncbi:Retrotransposon-derived protein PEG10 [Smittium culicis]|uniref:Retrotransposon-derived protein PEG10 n=1 Tax=Smittium culicis TaxID=133412 RepID=A0A1R1XR11_9FUNG|nr:Retrotransposon-derived protein PEG10 [Smittium culicis]